MNQATSARVAKLDGESVIEGYTIQSNQVKLGYIIHAFINIYTKSTYHKLYLSFIKTEENTLLIIIKLMEIVVLFLITDFDPLDCNISFWRT